MRHAKSSWDGGHADLDRPLNRRGQCDAPIVAKELLARGWSPEIVCHSHATRTTQTWQLMQEFFQPQIVVSLESLYLGSPSDIREAVLQFADDGNTGLVLGHNPGWESAATLFARQSIAMTTANAALFEIETETWRSVFDAEKKWTFVDLIRPKDLH